jgi:probable rRNA maturation factor
MKITVQNRQRLHKIDLPKIEQMANKLAVAVLENLKTNKSKAKWSKYLSKIDKSFTLSLIIVSPSAIKKLNKEWRAKNKETDVLSFPLIDLNSADISEELSFLNQTDKKSIVADSELFEFGELFISYEQAIIQAKEYRHNLDRELAFLFVHGLLHVFGFDHQNKLDEKEMFGRQREILNKSNYFR